MADIVIANGQHYKIIEGGRAFLDSLEQRLFSNNIAISPTVMPDAVTDEPVGDSGYDAVAPISNPFPNAFVTSGSEAVSSGFNPVITFDHDDGDKTIYGTFFTDPADSDVTVMAVLMDAPFTITVAGQVIVPQNRFAFKTYD